MSYLDTRSNNVVINLGDTERATFIRKTYTHLAGAIFLFAFFEYIFFSIGLGNVLIKAFSRTSGSGLSSILFMGVFFVAYFAAISFIYKLASSSSKKNQYTALFLAALLLSFIALPLISFTTLYAPNILVEGIKVTGIIVAALTAVVFITKKDFSFLRTMITMGAFVLLGLLVVSIFFGAGFELMVIGFGIILLSGSILYETSNVMHKYPEDKYISASISLLFSIITLFIYVVQFLLRFSSSE